MFEFSPNVPSYLPKCKENWPQYQYQIDYKANNNTSNSNNYYYSNFNNNYNNQQSNKYYGYGYNNSQSNYSNQYFYQNEYNSTPLVQYKPIEQQKHDNYSSIPLQYYSNNINTEKSHQFKEPSHFGQSQYPISKTNKRLSEDSFQQEVNNKRFRTCSQTANYDTNSYGYQMGPPPPIASNINTKKFSRSTSMIGEVSFNQQNYKNANEIKDPNSFMYTNNLSVQNNFEKKEMVNTSYANCQIKNETGFYNQNKPTYDHMHDSSAAKKKLYRATSMVYSNQNYKNNLIENEKMNSKLFCNPNNTVREQSYISSNYQNYDQFSRLQKPLYDDLSEQIETLISNDVNKISDDQSTLHEIRKPLVEKRELSPPNSKKNDLNNDIVIPSYSLSHTKDSIISDDVFNVMDSILSIFESIDNNSIRSSSNNGIFSHHIISSIFKITVGEQF